MPGIISGGAWLSDRRRFLQEELAKDQDADERSAIEVELALVDEELRAKRKHWWWRWLLLGGGGPRT